MTVLTAGVAVLFAVVTSRTELFNGTVEVPRSQWRAVRVSLNERPATVECSFTVTGGDSSVAVTLVDAVEFEKLKRSEDYRALAYVERTAKGEFRRMISRPGEYMVLFDNRVAAGDTARLTVRVSLAYNEFTSFEPVTLPASKRLAVVLASAGVFLLAAGWSGWRIWGVLRNSGRWWDSG